MRYLSLFSGIEAASVAWSRLGWEPVAFAEVDEFPSAVLAHRFPNVPNLGDIAKIDWRAFHERYGTIDVLVGGTPCQTFSVAGDRSGRAGKSGLMAEYIRAVRDLVRWSGGSSPRYIVWENVEGCLTVEGGEAFGQLLAELDQLGLSVAWRVLDAQFARIPDGSAGGFFGPVAQRRRRVFLVGVLGCAGAAEILFERSCLSGNHPPDGKAREAIASDPVEGVSLDCGRVTCMASNHTHAEICDGICTTQMARQYKDPPIVVMDRASFNQGRNAQYPPHVAETDLMDTIVARGPHAVCYQEAVESGENDYVVRRITPVECERLMGFSEGWTDITGCDADAVSAKVSESLSHSPEEARKLAKKVRRWSKSTPDTPRYKAIGNSMAVTCMMLIGRRIEAFDVLHYDEIGIEDVEY